MKIVIIGAGSRCFGAGMVKDILQAEELRSLPLELALVDIDSDALAQMTKLTKKICEYTGSSAIVTSHTDRKAALQGANYVIGAVEVSRMQLWEQDFRIPLAYGFQHCLGENGGPGALFHALRSLSVVIPICRDIENICPDALFLNFTNPEARVLHGICHLTKVKAVGLCHGVFSAMGAISRYLDIPVDDLHIISAGMNHFYCIQSVIDKNTNTEMLGVLLDKVKADKSPGLPGLFRKMVEIFDMFTYPSDDHIGEYLSFGSEYSGVKWPYGQESRKVRTEPEVMDIPVGDVKVDADFMQPSNELAVPIICDIEFDRGLFRPAVNVINTAKYIPNLPEHAVVEVPATVDKAGIHPMTVAALSEPLAAFMNTQYSIHALVTEAFRTSSRKLLLQALLLDPVVNSISKAEKMLDDFLEIQQDFLGCNYQ